MTLRNLKDGGGVGETLGYNDRGGLQTPFFFFKLRVQVVATPIW